MLRFENSNTNIKDSPCLNVNIGYKTFSLKRFHFLPFTFQSLNFLRRTSLSKKKRRSLIISVGTERRNSSKHVLNNFPIKLITIDRYDEVTTTWLNLTRPRHSSFLLLLSSYSYYQNLQCTVMIIPINIATSINNNR